MWNYRVIEFVEPIGDNVWRAIHEVYYDDDGKPTGYAEGHASVIWDADEGDEAPGNILEMMRSALSKPILREKDFHHA